MKREGMTKKVYEELEHIPHSYRGSDQNMLRVYYNSMRRHDLGQNPASSAKDSLLKAIQAVKKDKPDFLPIYDRELFR